MAAYTTDIAIIGAGPTGLFSVFEAGMAGFKTIVIDSLDELGGQLSALYPEKPIYDIPGYPSILAGELVEKLTAQAAPFNPTYLLGSPVESFQKENERFILKAGENTIDAKVVLIAAGGGMFAPRKPPLENLEAFEKTSVFYSVRGKEQFYGKTLVIAGGGDSAVDWAVELAPKAKHVHVVHRRADFRAAEETVRQMKALEAEGKITIHVGQLSALAGEGDQLSTVTIADLDKNTTDIAADTLLCFFGIAPSLGPVADWGLDFSAKKITVNPETMATSIPGVLAIGDIVDYPAKMSLILTGFAESALATKTAAGIINPDKKFKVVYSTSKGVPA